MVARETKHSHWVLFGLIAIFTVFTDTRLGTVWAQSTNKDDASQWPNYGRDAGGTRYSPLAQINRHTVGKLKIAWMYRTGDISDGKERPVSAFEATPLMVDNTLYLSTPFSRVIALDPQTGKERWTYDPHLFSKKYPFASDNFVSRGVSYWRDKSGSKNAPGSRRIFLGTYDGRLIALDATLGTPCKDFGQEGQIDLKRDVGTVRWGEYQITSPPLILGNLVIVGSGISDNHRVDAPSGVVRAFDTRTGALKWKFEPVPRDPADPARRTWAGNSADITGAGNAWTLLTADPDRDLVFVPTGSASPDFYGGLRLGDDLYTNCVVAIRARTGKVVWHFQVVHHDLWDYDVASAPMLVTVPRNGKQIPAVAVGTKMGMLFVLDRETGKPLFPVVERPVPQEGVDGEHVSPTQPFPTLPRPLVPQKLSLDDAFGLTPADRVAARQRVAALHFGSIYTPPSLQGTVLYPGNVGGMNWSGMSFDPERHLLFVNLNRLATVITLVSREKLKSGQNLTPREQQLVSHGPAQGVELGRQEGAPYLMLREWLLGPQRVPQTKPPWGTLDAVDLATGAVRWEVPLGMIPGLKKVPGAAAWGSPNLGGCIVTAGGLVFIAATLDNYLRAFDVETGKVVWKGALPAGGQATPMTYRLANGKQYIVLCAGGHGGLGSTLGDYVVAFSLP